MDDNKEKEKVKKPKKVLVDRGKFISDRSVEELAAYQKRKTIFMLLSTLFFAISLFLPVGGRTYVAEVLWANTAYIMLDIVLVALSIYVGYQGNKGQKIRGEVSFYDAPHYGYKALTYLTFEIFVLLHLGYLLVEIFVLVLYVEVWGIVNVVVAAASLAFAIVARQYLQRANTKHMEFLPPIEPDILPDPEAVSAEGADSDPTDNTEDTDI